MIIVIYIYIYYIHIHIIIVVISHLVYAWVYYGFPPHFCSKSPAGHGSLAPRALAMDSCQLSKSAPKIESSKSAPKNWRFLEVERSRNIASDEFDGFDISHLTSTRGRK